MDLMTALGCPCLEVMGMTHDGVIYLLELIDIAYGRARHDMTRQEMERTSDPYMDVMSGNTAKRAA